MPNRTNKFNWDESNIPQFKMPQCGDCEYNNVVAGRVECEIHGYPRPDQYVSNKIICPWRKKTVAKSE